MRKLCLCLIGLIVGTFLALVIGCGTPDDPPPRRPVPVPRPVDPDDGAKPKPDRPRRPR